MTDLSGQGPSGPRVAPAVCLLALLLLAGCQAPAAEPGRADPASDRLGWEDGYWYDDPIDVNNSDGLDAEERRAVVARTMARVEQVRGLEFERRVPIEIVARDEVDRFDVDFGDAGERWMNAEYEALFLVGEETDAASAYRDLLRQGAGGFYVPGEGTLKIISDSETPKLHGERVLAHELTHALQDQHADLDRQVSLSDPELAFRSVVEGDASLAEAHYMRRCGDGWDCLQGPAREMTGAQVQALNRGIALPFMFAYVDGVNFAAAWKRAGGWPAVTAAIEAPPAATETIMHPDRYGDESVREVSLRDASAAGWEPVTPADRDVPDRLGQARLSAGFVYTLIDTETPTAVVPREAVINAEGFGINRTDPLDFRLNYTTGWAGDAFRVYTDGEDLGYVLRTAWTAPAEAREFARGYRRLLAHWGGTRVGDGVWRVPDGPFEDAFRIAVDGDTVTVVNAPTREALGAVHPSGA